jgi:hypothetical protein
MRGTDKEDFGSDSRILETFDERGQNEKRGFSCGPVSYNRDSEPAKIEPTAIDC